MSAAPRREPHFENHLPSTSVVVANCVQHFTFDAAAAGKAHNKNDDHTRVHMSCRLPAHMAMYSRSRFSAGRRPHPPLRRLIRWVGCAGFATYVALYTRRE
eukprot:5799029-Pyramimonas_sp.AAC.1